MEVKIDQRVTLVDEVVTGYICDMCGKEIACEKCIGPQNRCDVRGPKYVTTKMLEVTTGHHDWGNDSVDSIETYHYCSSNCLEKAMTKYYETFDRSSESDTNYCDIQQTRECVYPECKAEFDRTEDHPDNKYIFYDKK